MKYFEVVAYAFEGELYCADHANFEPSDLAEGFVTPVFAGNEGWEDHCCGTCLAEAVEAGEKPLTLGESL